MDSIIEYRSDESPRNDYPRRIVSPVNPSACCLANMAQTGHGAIDAQWRFYYKRCGVCGYTVRCFYAPSLLAVFETGRQVRMALAEMSLDVGGRRRRTRAQIAAERAAAQRWPLHRGPKQQPVRMLRTGRLVPSAA
jgi:hypothetical protein